MNWLVDILNRSALGRLLVLVGVLVALAIGATWELSDSLHKIQTHLERSELATVKNSESIKRNSDAILMVIRKVEENTAFRHKAEGAGLINE